MFVYSMFVYFSCTFTFTCTRLRLSFAAWVSTRQGLNRLPMEYVFCRMDWLFQKEEQEAMLSTGRPRRISTPQEFEDAGAARARRMDR
jgi:hypothetical protein